MNEDNEMIMKGTISYYDLRQIIADYFKKFYDVELGFACSIDYFPSSIFKDNSLDSLFFAKTEFGNSKFDLTREDINNALKVFLADKNYELLSDIKYHDNDDVAFDFKNNINIKNEVNSQINVDKSNIVYDVSIGYVALRQIIFDYYKEKYNVELGSISIDYWKEKLTGNDIGGPFFVRRSELGETRFDLSYNQVKEIFSSYLADKGYELQNLNFDHDVQFKYTKKNVKQEYKQAEEKVEQNESEERKFFSESYNTKMNNDEVNKIGTVDTEERVPFFNSSIYSDVLKQNNDSYNPQDELVKMAKEKRKFTILQRERAMSDAQKGKNRASIMAGLCILGAICAGLFREQDLSQIIQHELDAIYSWESLVQYIKDLGPLTTILCVSAGGFISKYCKYSKMLKNAKNEFIDFNSSLTNTYSEGGNRNDRSR